MTSSILVDKNIRGLLFDKDGTLILFEESWKPVILEAVLKLADGDQALANEMLNASGFDTGTQKFVAGGLLAGGTAEQVLARWAGFLPNITREKLREIESWIVANQIVVAVEGLEQRLIEWKDAGYKLGVATNDIEKLAKLNLQQLGWLGHFDFVAGSDSGFGGKPGPGMMAAFCQACDLEASQVAMVGDNWQDLEMAKRGGAGLKVGVLTGTSDRETLEPLADFVLETAIEL